MSIKKILLLTILFLTTKFIFSQTDGCGAGSTLLTPGAAGAACTAVAGSTTAAFTDSNQGCANGNEDDDGYYMFVATATSHTITVDGAANFDPVLGVYNTCGGTQPTGGACVDATGTDGIETRTITGLTIGNTYFICVHDFAAGFGDFTICITTPAAPPSNDACSSPISLTPGAAGVACAPTAGSSLTATASGQGCTTGNEDDDVWYSFIATGTTHTVLVDGAANMDAVLGVYTTCAGAQPTGGACVDATGGNGNETVTVTGLTIGVTYFICIYDFAAGGGDFTVCVTTPAAAPANDLCSGVITTACGGTYSSSTSLATTTSDPTGTCGTGVGAAGVWYLFVGDGNNITASLCGSSYDTKINVYSGSCGALSCITGNDDFCGTSSEVTFTSTLGVNYYIFVNGFSGALGSFTLAITCAAPPTPTAADCGGATTICSNANLVGNSSGGGNIDDFTAANTDCLDPPENQTTWLYFSSSTNGTIGLTITPALTTDDYDWAIWGPMASVTCPPPSAPIRCSAADGNGTPANITGLGNGAGDTSEGPTGDGWVSLLNVLAGEIYIMVIDNWTGTSSPFTLSWQTAAGATLDCTPLPIEILNFNAITNSNKIELSWATATEVNNDYFTVERSKDGVAFEEIFIVNGAGTSTTIKNYFEIDYHPIVGVSYYRLKQTDFNGSISYSNIVPVRYQPNGNFGFSLFPNPGEAKDIKIELSAAKGQNILVVVRDIAGREFYSKVFVTETDGNKIEAIDTEHILAPGIYMVTASSNDAFYSQKLVIKK